MCEDGAGSGITTNRQVGSIFAQLKQRGVLKAATAYLVLSWLTLEIGHTLFLIFELPHVVLQILFVLLALGFPLATVAAWHYGFAAPMQADEHTHAKGHEAPLAMIFGGVAILVIAVVIVTRFMGYEEHDSPHDTGADPATAELHATPTTARASPPEPSAQFSPPERSVAVMPFVNVSGDTNDEYFSDGLSEELMTSLARINELHVAARTSSFSFKGAAADIPTIGRKLNVAAVLEGSVRKVGSRVRINAQLIDAATGFELWSDFFDRDLTDIFALQTEIATAVTEKLRVELLGDLASKLRYGGTDNAAAYDAYLRGLKLANLRSDEATARGALAAFEEAVRLDPNFALALAQLGSAMFDVAGAWTVDENESEALAARARAESERAVALAPASGVTHALYAQVIRGSTLDWIGSASAARRAVELEPGNAEVLTLYANVYGDMGLSAEALQAAARAVQLDPLSHRAWRAQGVQLYYARRHADAAKSFEQALVLEPMQRLTRSWMALNDIVSGSVDRAIELCSTNDSWEGGQCLAIAYHKQGRHDEATRALRALEQEYGDALAYQYAEIHAQWDEPKRALEWLATAVRLQDGGLQNLKATPLLDPIRATPEFAAIEAQLNFPR
jgi:TolB-like protein